MSIRRRFHIPGFKLQILAVCLLIPFLAFQAFADGAVDRLVESELAFARAASEKGIKAAFVSYLSDDSILFRPRKVSGKEWMSSHPDVPGILMWEPSYAEISGAGDLGFTTGPYTYKASAEAKEASYGQFFSIWKKQPDGSWKVFLDAGTEFDQQKEKSPLKTRTGKGTVVSEAERKKQEQAVTAADRAPEAFLSEALVLHDQEYGKKCTFAQDGSGISASADLAYVYGTLQCDLAQGIYVRTWRRTDRWQVAVDYRKHL